MIIIDKSKNVKAVAYVELIPGNIYLDIFGNYVIATDSESLLNLETGEGYGWKDYSNEVDEFMPLNASLVIE